ncbi:c-type cytochrome [Pseudooceanicola sediminis]|nr:cytochrome c [Pseudooceanicola sediminis]
MKHFILTMTIGAMTLTGAALANAEVSNPAVKDRMDLMGTIRGSFAVLGGMAQGKVDFDADKATSAQATLVEAAAKIPAKFEPNEADPESEALPAIWENWDDFVDHAAALETAAAALDPSSLETVKAGVGKIGASCGGCHQTYRMK